MAAAHVNRTAVLGGGITGLTLALRLAEAGDAVTVFDAATELGGNSVAADFDGFRWDRFYHVVAPQDRSLLGLLGQLGLADSVHWVPTVASVWMAGAVHPMQGPLDLLRLPGMGLLAKLRLGMLALRASAPATDAELDGTSAADWLTARCGREAWDRMWRHLLRAKLGDLAPRASARFVHATLRRLATARRAGGSDRFGFVDGGYAVVLDRLCAALRTRGVQLRTATRVLEARHDAAARDVAVVHARGTERFDRVVCTLPNPHLADVLPDLDHRVAARLRATPYLGVACTVVTGSTPLAPGYVTNLCDDRLAVTGILETSRIIGTTRCNGSSLVYLPRYAAADSAVLDQTDDQLAGRALVDLRLVYPAAAAAGWLRSVRVHRTRWIQPVPVTGMPPTAPPSTVVPGRIHCVNHAQLPGCVLNNDECIALADRAAADLTARA